MTSELPDDLRIPLHELQADARSLVMRVAVDGSVASMVVDSVETKLSHVAEAAYRLNGKVNDQAARIEALEAALKPFADAYLRKRIEYAKRYGADVEIGFKNFDKMPEGWRMEGITFTMGTFRRAASLLEKKL